MPMNMHIAVTDDVRVRSSASIFKLIDKALYTLTQIIPVILCGGSGTRLWPKSRKSMPKPFLPLVSEMTLFEETLQRCSENDSLMPPIIVTGKNYLKHVKAQLGNAHDCWSIIVEPAARNTAAAIGIAAARLPPDAIMIVCPSDHYIGKPDFFAICVEQAVELAGQGWLVSFGIEATSPETGYGYLERGEKIGEWGYRVENFVEKPSYERAREFLASGHYFWNGGIFAFRVGDFQQELELHRPETAQAVREAVEKGKLEDGLFYPETSSFERLNSESVDYAVMENTTRAAMVVAKIEWSDIGNWRSLYNAKSKDISGNNVIGDVELVECKNVIVDTDGPSVSAIGLENIVIAVNNGNILVMSINDAEKVGKLNKVSEQ